jgi:5,10-methylenetetrahydrofolate reductase
VDLVDNQLKGAPEFCAGAVVNPEAAPLEPQLMKFEKKVRAGAEFSRPWRFTILTA